MHDKRDRLVDRVTLEGYQDPLKVPGHVAKYVSYDRAIVHQRLAELFPKGSQLLALGEGAALDAEFLAERGRQVLVTDASAGLLRSAEERTSSSGARSNLRFLRHILPLNFPPEIKPDSLDGVYSIACLMHLRGRGVEKVLLNVARVLKPDGAFYFTFPEARDDLDDNGRDVNGRFYNCWNRSEWLQAVERVNARLASTDVHLVQDGLVDELGDLGGRPGVKFCGLCLKKK